MAGPHSQTNLIVNYLPQSLTDEEFRSMFMSIGTINSCKIIRDRATGYSYGFGFVDYQRAEDAENAISTLNGLQLQNKTLKVAYARPPGEESKNTNLYITGVPRHMAQEDLSSMFNQFGKVIQTRVLVDQITGLSKGVGFVLFATKEDAQKAIDEWHGKTPSGGSEALNITFADNRGKARPPPPVGPPQHQNSGYNNGGGMRGGYGGGPGPMRNMGPGNRGGHRYNPMMGNSNQEGYVLFVYNIGLDATESTLWQLFAPYGAIQKVNCIFDHAKEQCKGYGFVTMSDYNDAVNAIQSLSGYYLNDKPLQVSFKSPKA